MHSSQTIRQSPRKSDSKHHSESQLAACNDTAPERLSACPETKNPLVQEETKGERPFALTDQLKFQVHLIPTSSQCEIFPGPTRWVHRHPPQQHQLHLDGRLGTPDGEWMEDVLTVDSPNYLCEFVYHRFLCPGRRHILTCRFSSNSQYISSQQDCGAKLPSPIQWTHCRDPQPCFLSRFLKRD
jgi:hypothetical protein